MDSFLGLGLDLPELLILIAAIVAAIVAIRFTATFDINRFIETRKKGYSQKFRNACTHIDISPLGDGKFRVTSLFRSPPGTLVHTCQKCGLQRYLADGEIEQSMAYYGEHIDEYLGMNKRFYKLLKKSGQI